jgi:hypothetical protein
MDNTPPQVNSAINMGQGSATPQAFGGNYITPPNTNQSLGYSKVNTNNQAQGVYNDAVAQPNSNVNVISGQLDSYLWDNVGSNVQLQDHTIPPTFAVNAASTTPPGTHTGIISNAMNDYAALVNVNMTTENLQVATNYPHVATPVALEGSQGGIQLSAPTLANTMVNPSAMMLPGFEVDSKDVTEPDTGAGTVSKVRPDSVVGVIDERVNATQFDVDNLEFVDPTRISVDELENLFDFP